MKKIYAVLTGCALSLAIAAAAFAQCGQPGGGCGSCNKGGAVQAAPAVPGSAADIKKDDYRLFMQNTIDLRQEMMNKRFGLQRENLKATPDSARVAVLKAEITALQARINAVRVQSGLPDEGKRDGECFKMDGGCEKQSGFGGCDGQPCWKK